MKKFLIIVLLLLFFTACSSGSLLPSPVIETNTVETADSENATAEPTQAGVGVEEDAEIISAYAHGISGQPPTDSGEQIDDTGIISTYVYKISEHRPPGSGKPVDMSDQESSVTAENALVSDFFAIQQSVDEGSQPWRISPGEAALDFIRGELGLTNGELIPLSGESSDYSGQESARVNYKKEDGAVISIDLYQPVKKGRHGIWLVDCWYDENSRKYQVRDLSALPPMFYNDENIPQEIRDIVRERIKKEWAEVFGQYYQVLGFEANDVSFNVTGGNSELEFSMTMITQNFYRDPDTLDHIKELKETNSPHYRQIYDEYNSPQINNFHMKAVVSADGDVELFTNESPYGTDFQPVKASDFLNSK